MRALVVVGLVYFPYQAKRLVGESSPKLPVLCRVRRKPQLNQSINQYPQTRSAKTVKESPQSALQGLESEVASPRRLRDEDEAY